MLLYNLPRLGISAALRGASAQSYSLSDLRKSHHTDLHDELHSSKK